MVLTTCKLTQFQLNLFTCQCGQLSTLPGKPGSCAAAANGVSQVAVAAEEAHGLSQVVVAADGRRFLGQEAAAFVSEFQVAVARTIYSIWRCFLNGWLELSESESDSALIYGKYAENGHYRKVALSSGKTATLARNLL